ncbi:hypothetical protein MJO28_007579 [Puccinia striiformis f. sp. tritici]|uniref:Secreted protein n=5 Tax=Puccinia striiformis TaxID=27350 RepID=A0A0L0VS61_9BASI|nr:hypothetical protein Pst134EA_013688 [Puccinia striiformis f. sp. tritici]KAI9604068.1 hypothetical protein H4Q26_003678 [Puccinia striiformis f. sp. tritici PST-130]KNF02111.1 hypothetical protein PSTG_04609 [Puccinia striiformis f. sp. tritici PST-78]POW09476.1 hypothetical protein PSTT_06784 [Puccinia striiformis]KAH9465825.1 hypothetical protein Pst134EA_013688 [Puccinia striiformis f. sp. tritici]KAI7951895.1 hypothetical protein MJO28_007579 [Puccinia striiformis f. sp. tritici]
MQVSYLAAAVLMAYATNAQVPAGAAAGAQVASAGKPAPPGGKQPTLVPMNCTQAYLPFSEADVAAMSSNDPKAAAGGNYSTIPTEAACKGPAGSVDGLCDIGSCGNHPVCNTCVELIITGPNTTTKGTKTIPQVTCTNNYFFGNSTDPIKNVCTDANDKTYTCTGGCASYTSCQLCVSVNDPALQGP